MRTFLSPGLESGDVEVDSLASPSSNEDGLARTRLITISFRMEETVYKTPIGELKLVANGEGMCAVKWLFGKHSVSSRNKIPEAVGKASADSSKAQEHLRACQRWLDAYFDGSLLAAKPAIPKPPLVLPDKSI